MYSGWTNKVSTALLVNCAHIRCNHLMATDTAKMSSTYITQITQFLSQNRTQIHDVVLVTTIIASLTWVMYIALQTLKSRYQTTSSKTTRASTPDVEKNKRKYGGTFFPLFEYMKQRLIGNRMDAVVIQKTRAETV